MLEGNGTLRTATIFDYETNASIYSIRIQVRDDQNATAEGNFSVILIDVDEAPPGQPDKDTNSTSDNNQTGVNEPNPDNNSSQPTLPMFETYRFGGDRPDRKFVANLGDPDSIDSR